MTRIRRINQSQVEGGDSNNTDTSGIRPLGEMAVYVGANNKLELLMFDGVRTHLRSKVLSKGTFYGGDADSSDGLNCDTIKLIPDAELLYNDQNNHQYLIIDPTAAPEGPEHIHIRAGGAIDASTADLFLGGERNNVRVSDTNDRVTVTTDPGEGTYAWTFDNNGTLTFPDSTETTGKSITVPVNESLTVNLPFDDGIIGTTSFKINASMVPSIKLPSGNGVIYAGTEINENKWGLDSANKTLFFPDAGDNVYPQIRYSTTGDDGMELFTAAKPVKVTVASNTSWSFGTDGGLTFPDNSAQTTAYPGVLVPADGDTVSGNANMVFYAGTDWYTTSRVTINPTSSMLTINGNSGTGGVTFPDATVQTTAFTGTGAITFTGNEIEGNTFGGTGTIITKTEDNTGDNFSTGSGSIGFLNFGADGTIQNVKAGWTVTFASGVTRTVLQDAYQPLGTYWNIGFTSGYIWSAGDVMPVTFSSPDYVAGTDPQVTLTAGTESWSFDDNGSLTFPDATTQTTAWKGIPGPYADDAAAATAGVAVGNPYHKTGTSGQVFVRLA